MDMDIDTDTYKDTNTDMACAQHFDFFVHFINVIKNLTNAHNLRSALPTVRPFFCPSVRPLY